MTIDPTYILTGAITILIYFIRKWIGGVETSVNRIGDKVNHIELTLAIQETKISDGKNLRESLDKLKQDYILLDSQVKAAWKAIDRMTNRDLTNIGGR